MTDNLPTAHGTIDLAARLAEEHGAATLAMALLVRLRADGRAEEAAAIAAMLDLDPNPPHPHKSDGGM